VRHNLARPGGFRRPLQVPNPRSFVRLADECESQWTRISAHVSSNPFSMSAPVVTRTLERALRPRFRFGERDRLRPRDWRGQRFVLRTDVSQFYASLYTHSIPWALEGKRVAKQNLGKTPSDKLDKALRNVSDGQTMGVPIGPDTSFLAAEIVLTAVDRALAKKVRMRGHRYIDDYELAFRSRSEAEEAQALLEEELAHYELAINPTKTEVLELPQPFLEGWTHELATFPIRSANSSQTLTISLHCSAVRLP
jgi:Reverse transcriptase (RNA-dependent DNA polymerase)